MNFGYVPSELVSNTMGSEEWFQKYGDADLQIPEVNY